MTRAALATALEESGWTPGSSHFYAGAPRLLASPPIATKHGIGILVEMVPGDPSSRTSMTLNAAHLDGPKEHA